MDPARPGSSRNVIDLTSDNEDSDDLGEAFLENAELLDEPFDFDEFLREPSGPNGFIDLTGLEDIPDVDVPPNEPSNAPPSAPQHGSTPEEQQTISEAQSLQMILDVLPEVAVDYVLQLVNERQIRTTTGCERLITELLDKGSYPTEGDELNRKRKRGDSDGQESDRPAPDPGAPGYQQYHQNA